MAYADEVFVANCQEILRGGSWDGYGYYLRSASRCRDFPGNLLYHNGFRVVVSL